MRFVRAAGPMVIALLVGCGSGAADSDEAPPSGDDATTDAGDLDGTSDGAGEDTSPSDSTLADGMTDGSTSDGTTSDGSTSDGTTSDGSTSDGTTSDGTTTDATGSDGTTGDGATTTCAPITGTSAFAVALSGSVSFVDKTVPPHTVEAQLYFPNGRVAGQPVILARRNAALSWAIAKGTLAAGLGATSLSVLDPDCNDSLDGALLGPSDGVLAYVKVDVTAPSDAVDLKPGVAKLCAVGPIDTPKLSAEATVAMRDPIDLVVNLPVDATTTGAITLSAGAVPITTTVLGPSVRLVPTGAYLPSATMPVALGGMSDLLARPFPTPSSKVFVWSPTGYLPAGSIGFTIDMIAGYGASFSLVDSELRLVPDASAARYGLAVGLESKAGTTKIRIHHRFDCTSFAGTARAAILGSAGEVVPLSVACAAASVEEVVTLPGTGKHYLWIDATPPASRPCWTPSPKTLPQYVLTSYGLE